MVESKTIGSRAFTFTNITILSIMLVLTLYPCWHVLMASFSDPMKMYTGSKLVLVPRGTSLAAYKIIIKHTMLWKGYANTLLYVSLSLIVGVALTTVGAYVFSRAVLPGKSFMLMLIMITMFFGGGLIPTFMVVLKLGLVDTIWSMVLPNALSTYNMIMMMTYLRGIPQSLEESAHIDGANDMTILIRIMVPLALPVLAVISLYILVGNWNSYIPATIYLRDRNLFPLQVILREILMSGSSNLDTVTTSYSDVNAYSEAVKYATIIVSTLPVLIVYPFLQRFFVKGVMLGAVKG